MAHAKEAQARTQKGAAKKAVQLLATLETELTTAWSKVDPEAFRQSVTLQIEHAKKQVALAKELGLID